MIELAADSRWETKVDDEIKENWTDVPDNDAVQQFIRFCRREERARNDDNSAVVDSSEWNYHDGYRLR